MNVSRNLAMGGSICHVLRRSDTLGDPRSNETVKLGGSVKEEPHVRARAELGSYEDLMKHQGIWLWEAQVVVFHKGLKLWEVHGLTKL